MVTSADQKSSINFLLNTPQISTDVRASTKPYSATYPPLAERTVSSKGFDQLLSAADILTQRDASSFSTQSSSSTLSRHAPKNQAANRSRPLSKPPMPPASLLAPPKRSPPPMASLASPHTSAIPLSSSSSSPSTSPELQSKSTSLTHREDTSIQKTCKRRRRQNIQCEACGRAFGDSSSARKHYRVVHLKIKEFKCDDCGKTFAEKSNRSKHYIAAHLNQRSHPCPDCDKVFNFTDGLRRHRNNVHLGLRPYQCADCNTWYKQKTHLLKHRQAVHGVALPAKSESDWASTHEGDLNSIYDVGLMAPDTGGNSKSCFTLQPYVVIHYLTYFSIRHPH